MGETVDDLTISYMENGLETVKELSKEVLTKGAWSTLLYRYQEWDQKKECYGPVKFGFRRYQKRDGIYKQKSKFNISSIAQAQKVIEILQSWIALSDEDEQS